MRMYWFTTSFLLIVLFFISCDSDKSVDTEKPEIDMSAVDAFPNSCDTLYFGESFDLRLVFSDNVELGSFSIDIHHNFDHHSHSTEIIECNLGEESDPINPYVYIEDFSIPEGVAAYETDLSLTIPSLSDLDSLDSGDYHFSISLTDHEGWSTQTGLSIKMYYR